MSEPQAILVVDCDKTAQALVAAQAARLGLDCTVMDSSEAALAAVEDDEPALAVAEHHYVETSEAEQLDSWWAPTTTS